MGNSSCATCDCRSDREVKTSFASEFDNFPQTRREGVAATPPISGLPDYSRTQNSVICIQKYWRAYVTRKEYQHLVKSKRSNRFFTREEVRETLKAGKGSLKAREQRGPYTYSSGSIYQGQWRGGFRDGYGVQIWPGSSKYEGNWSYGWPFGIGKFTLSAGEVYEGAWKDIWASGQASVCISGPTAVSGFTSGVTDGYLWLWYREELVHAASPTRRKAVGSKRSELEAKLSKMKSMVEQTKRALETGHEPSDLFKANLRAFKRKEYEDGKVYEGEFAEDRRDGRGKVTWVNGDSYEGEWRNDNQHGLGRNIFSNGSAFIGSFKDNLKHGLGEYRWEDGSIYIGEWQGNKMQGVGEYVWPDGRRYMGEWSTGVMHGYGVLEWKDGKKYEGGWEQGKKHGEGITTTVSGTVSRDVWKQGKILKVTPK